MKKRSSHAKIVIKQSEVKKLKTQKKQNKLQKKQHRLKNLVNLQQIYKQWSVNSYKFPWINVYENHLPSNASIYHIDSSYNSIFCLDGSLLLISALLFDVPIRSGFDIKLKLNTLLLRIEKSCETQQGQYNHLSLTENWASSGIFHGSKIMDKDSMKKKRRQKLSWQCTHSSQFFLCSCLVIVVAQITNHSWENLAEWTAPSRNLAEWTARSWNLVEWTARNIHPIN